RCLDLSEFPYLRYAEQLAVAVADMNRRGYRAGIEVAGRRDYGSNAGANVVAFNAGRMADEHAVDIGNGVLLAGREDAGHQADIPGSWPFLRKCRAGQQHGCCDEHAYRRIVHSVLPFECPYRGAHLD